MWIKDEWGGWGLQLVSGERDLFFFIYISLYSWADRNTPPKSRAKVSSGTHKYFCQRPEQRAQLSISIASTLALNFLFLIPQPTISSGNLLFLYILKSFYDHASMANIFPLKISSRSICFKGPLLKSTECSFEFFTLLCVMHMYIFCIQCAPCTFFFTFV